MLAVMILKSQFLAPTYLFFIFPPTPFSPVYNLLRAISSCMPSSFADIAKPTGIKEIYNKQKNFFWKFLVCAFSKNIIISKICGQLLIPCLQLYHHKKTTPVDYLFSKFAKTFQDLSDLLY